jgi:hypothetical protein
VSWVEEKKNGGYISRNYECSKCIAELIETVILKAGEREHLKFLCCSRRWKGTRSFKRGVHPAADHEPRGLQEEAASGPSLAW